MPAHIVGAFEEDRLTLIGGPELPSPEIHSLGAAFGAPGGSVRGERANLTGLVNGCIEAKFCNKICVGRRNPYIVQETNVGKTATKMTATIDFAMQFKKLHESGMQVSNICGCLEFHPSCIPALLSASSK